MPNEDGKQTVEEQIDDMLNIGVEKPAEEPPVEDPLVEDPSEEEPPAEEPPKEELPIKDPPSEEPPVEPPEEEPPPEPDPDLDQLRKDNEELRKRIDEMSTPEPEPKPDEPKEPKSEPLDEIDFIGDAEVDDITRDPKEFNKLLNKVFAQGVDTTRKTLGEGILRSIPDIVKNNVATVINLRKASDEFYDKNEDLRPFKKVVAAVFEEVAAENPDRKFDEILGDVGIEVRKRLELHKKAVNPEPEPDPKNNPPKLPRKKSQSRKSLDKPNLDPLLAEIDEMNKSL